MKHDDLDWIPLTPELQAEMARQTAEGALLAARQKKAGNIVLAYHNGDWFALRDRCPHQGFALAGGRVTPEGRVECPYHKFTFGVADGREPSGTCSAVQTFPLRRRNEQYEIGVKRSIWSYLKF
ncbi:MAG: Rieske (2Fe-2S) protein [Flavobacteriales bacterium]|nr:Rieske (2Fe-2S) protein [Flavobacteriales bacterium]